MLGFQVGLGPAGQSSASPQGKGSCSLQVFRDDRHADRKSVGGQAPAWPHLLHIQPRSDSYPICCQVQAAEH